MQLFTKSSLSIAGFHPRSNAERVWSAEKYRGIGRSGWGGFVLAQYSDDHNFPNFAWRAMFYSKNARELQGSFRAAAGQF